MDFATSCRQGATTTFLKQFTTSCPRGFSRRLTSTRRDPQHRPPDTREGLTQTRESCNILNHPPSDKFICISYQNYCHLPSNLSHHHHLSHVWLTILNEWIHTHQAIESKPKQIVKLQSIPIFTTYIQKKINHTGIQNFPVCFSILVLLV